MYNELKSLTIRQAVMALATTQAVMIAPAAMAQDNDWDAGQTQVLAPIMITAEKIPALEKDTPISMTITTGDELAQTNTDDSMDLVQRVPNLHMVRAGNHSGVSFFSIRGSTNAAEDENNAVGFFIDGVSQKVIDTEFLDVNRIEVLRGPQSTLYGRNTETGAINVITNDPTPYAEGSVTAGFGNYGRKEITAIVGGPLGEEGRADWSFRGAFRLMSSDGFFTRVQDGKDDVDKRRDINGRLKLRWNPDSPWDIISTLDIQRYKDGSTSFAPLDMVRSDPGKVTADFVGKSDVSATKGSIHAVYKATDFTVTSITALANEKIPDVNDTDFTAADIYRLDIDGEVDRFTQELRLSSPENSQGIRWLAGLYYYNQDYRGDYDFISRPGSGFPFTQSVRGTIKTENIAAFGQLSVPFLDKFSVTAGLRYDYEKQELDRSVTWDPELPSYGMANSSRIDNQEFDAWIPKLGFEYKIQPDILGYASVARGYKSGGYNATAVAGREEFEPEFTMNYEVGMKAQLLDNRLTANLSLFWIDWEDQQVELQYFPTGAVTQNAGTSTSRGVEVELSWKPTDTIMLEGGFGYNDAHFVEYLDPVANADYGGNRPANAPQYTYNLGARYNITQETYVRADWLYTGDFYYDNANTKKEDGYGIFNLSLGYENERWKAKLWTKNLLDEGYATRAFKFDNGTWYGRAGEPRTFGASLGLKW